MNNHFKTYCNSNRMTLKTVISTAKEFGVPERYAIMRRLAFLQPHIKHLEREIWGAERRIERSCQSALKIDPPSASKIDPPQVVVFSY